MDLFTTSLSMKKQKKDENGNNEAMIYQEKVLSRQ